jgi:predicted nucleic acid-binding protein
LGHPVACLHEFLSVVTHPRVYAPPTPLARAIDEIEAWLESPTLVVLSEGPTHWLVLRALLTDGRIMGGQVHDARIAALCRQHGVREFWSADRDLSRFPGLNTVNPLVAA